MRTVTVIVPARPWWTARPGWVTQLGRRLHPEQVTDAWYTQNCPAKLDRAGLHWLVVVRWRLACVLRGVS